MVEISEEKSKEEAKNRLRESFNLMQDTSFMQVELLKWRREMDEKKTKALISGLEKYYGYVVEKVFYIKFWKEM